MTLPTAPLPAGAAPDPQQTPESPQKSAKLIAAIVVLAVLLVAALALSLFALLRPATTTPAAAPAASTTPLPSTSPSPKPPTTPKPATPTASTPQNPQNPHTPTNMPHPQPTSNPQQALGFTSFQPSGAAVVCTDDSEVYPITFSWSSENATAAWFGIDTPNAQAAPLQEVAPNDSLTWDFFCSNQSTTYTVTLADDHGALVHRSVVVERQ